MAEDTPLEEKYFSKLPLLWSTFKINENITESKWLWSTDKEVNAEITESKWFKSQDSMKAFSEFALELISISKVVLSNPDLKLDILVDVYNEAIPYISNLIISLGSRIHDCKWANGLLAAFDNIGVPVQQPAQCQGM